VSSYKLAQPIGNRQVNQSAACELYTQIQKYVYKQQTTKGE
jgi:hypothetical protein